MPGCRNTPLVLPYPRGSFWNQFLTGMPSPKAELGRGWQRRECARKTKELKQGYRWIRCWEAKQRIRKWSRGMGFNSCLCRMPWFKEGQKPCMPLSWLITKPFSEGFSYFPLALLASFDIAVHHTTQHRSLREQTSLRTPQTLRDELLERPSTTQRVSFGATHSMLFPEHMNKSMAAFGTPSESPAGSEGSGSAQQTTPGWREREPEAVWPLLHPAWQLHMRKGEHIPLGSKKKGPKSVKGWRTRVPPAKHVNTIFLVSSRRKARRRRWFTAHLVITAPKNRKVSVLGDSWPGHPQPGLAGSRDESPPSSRTELHGGDSKAQPVEFWDLPSPRLWNGAKPKCLLERLG